jgi:hypothetical protein
MKHVFASILWSVQCFKKIGDGPIKVTRLKIKKSKHTLGATPSLINRGDYRYLIISCISF